jgi:hypothetical protein
VPLGPVDALGSHTTCEAAGRPDSAVPRSRPRALAQVIAELLSDQPVTILGVGQPAHHLKPEMSSDTESRIGSLSTTSRLPPSKSPSWVSSSHDDLPLDVLVHDEDAIALVAAGDAETLVGGHETVPDRCPSQFLPPPVFYTECTSPIRIHADSDTYDPTEFIVGPVGPALIVKVVTPDRAKGPQYHVLSIGDPLRAVNILREAAGLQPLSDEHDPEGG